MTEPDVAQVLREALSLQEFVKPGSCRIISLGERCSCVKCKVERIVACVKALQRDRDDWCDQVKAMEPEIERGAVAEERADKAEAEVARLRQERDDLRAELEKWLKRALSSTPAAPKTATST